MQKFHANNPGTFQTTTERHRKASLLWGLVILFLQQGPVRVERLQGVNLGHCHSQHDASIPDGPI